MEGRKGGEKKKKAKNCKIKCTETHLFTFSLTAIDHFLLSVICRFPVICLDQRFVIIISQKIAKLIIRKHIYLDSA